MKRFLLSAIAIFAMSMCSFAQSIVCTDNACTPITDQPFSNTSVPYYCPQSLTFEQGQAVDVCITINCPETTSIDYNGMQVDATVTNLTIVSLSMPEGLSYCVSSVELDPVTNDYATIHITGTAPLVNEDDTIMLSGIFNGSLFGGAFPLQNQGVNFSTGIIITIGQGSEEPEEPETPEIVCETTSCEPVTNQTMSETTIPYYAPDALTYNVNEAVDVCVTIQCPATVSLDYNGYQGDATITDMTITEFSNLPNGLSYCVNRVNLDQTTNNFATIHITGTPTAIGVFNLNLSCVVNGSAMAGMMPLNNFTTPEPVPTGIVITIEEETSEFIEAHFTANPEIQDNYGDMGFVSIYQGESITFTNASTNAHHIVWTFTGGDIETSTENVVTVTYAEVGSFSTTLTAYNADESESSTKTVTIGVTPQPQNEVVANFTTNPEATQLLGGSTVYITAGQTITYTNTSENATSIEWSFEGGTPSTSENNTVEVTYCASGNYTTTLIAHGANNEQDTKTVGVNVSAAPTPVFNVDFTADVTTIETGDTVHFTNNTTVTLNDEPYTDTVHYQWLFNTNSLLTPDATSTEENPSYAYETAGVYTVALAASDREIMIHEIAGGWYPVKIKEDYIIVTDPVSVDENAISEINVYPNPTSSVINIAAENMQNITIMDMTGRVVMSKDVNSNFETISAEGFANANYMVRIATADGVVVKNIVVE